MPKVEDKQILVSTKVYLKPPKRFSTQLEGKEFWGINPSYGKTNAEFMDIFAKLKKQYNKKIVATPWPFQKPEDRKFCIML